MGAFMRDAVTALALCCVVVTPTWLDARQTSFKVYISADMEGVAGLVSDDQVGAEGAEYPLGRRLMTAEVNAAVTAAFEAGATEVVVNDAHGSATNLRPDEIDQRVVLITGRPKPHDMMEGLDSSFAAAIFIGYHARASTTDGVMAHTYTLQIKHTWINEHEVGEPGLNAALAGYYGVPVVMISGDRATIDETRELVPAVEGVVVKEGIGWTAARTLSPETARQRIAAGVRAGLARRADIQPVKLSQPVVLTMELARAGRVDMVMLVPNMKRVNARTVSYEASNMAEAYGISVLIDVLSSQ